MTDDHSQAAQRLVQSFYRNGGLISAAWSDLRAAGFCVPPQPTRDQPGGRNTAMSEDTEIALVGRPPAPILPLSETRAELKHLKKCAEKTIKVMGKIDQEARTRVSLNAERRRLLEAEQGQVRLLDGLRSEERVYTKDDAVIVAFVDRQKELMRQNDELTRQTHEFCDFADAHRAAGHSVALETHGFHVFPYLSQRQRDAINQYREAFHEAQRADQQCATDKWDIPRLEVFNQNVLAWAAYWQAFRMAVQHLLAAIVRKIGSLETERSQKESGGLSLTVNAVLAIIKAQPQGQGLSGKEIIAKLKARVK